MILANKFRSILNSNQMENVFYSLSVLCWNRLTDAVLCCAVLVLNMVKGYHWFNCTCDLFFVAFFVVFANENWLTVWIKKNSLSSNGIEKKK